MKITKSQLKQIIAEELAAVKKEGRFSKSDIWTKTGYDLALDAGDDDASGARKTPGESLGDMIGEWLQDKLKFIVQSSGGEFILDHTTEDRLIDLQIHIREQLLEMADAIHPEEEEDAYDDDDEDYWERELDERLTATEGKKKS